MTLRRKTLALVLLVAVLACAFTVFDRSDAPAAAATTGAGYANITPYGGYLGNYIAPDGTRVYCIDSGRDWPSAATDGGQVVTSLDSLSPTTVRKLNYALLRWGQTADPTNAAAVSAYVYAYTSNYAQTFGSSFAAGAHYINGNSAVLAAYTVVWRESERDYAGTSHGSATVSISLANAYDGSVTVSTTPARATGTLTLTGAVVAGTRNASIRVTNGSVVPITGAPGAGAQTYSIGASATFLIDDGAQQNLVLYSSGSQQRTIRGAFTESLSFGDSDNTGSIALMFSPVVTTQVASQFVADGGAFVDVVTARVSDGSAAWQSRETEFVPVIATGTLYGPFSEQPDVAAAPPATAPVVGTERLTLVGPGDYRSAGSLRAPGAGFYTWVWAIAASDQTPEVSALLPAQYRFADQFGLVAESHIVPMRISATTQVSVAETGLGGVVTDQLAVTLHEGDWLSIDGKPVEAIFEGTAYFVAGDTAPQASDTVPADAVALTTATVTATAPGIYEGSASAKAPEATPGFITWMWRLSPTSPFAAYFEPWHDKFGLAAETTRVAPPTVATQAQSASAIGDDVHDTAMVGGALPAQPGFLVFQAYLQVSGGAVTCDDSTLAYDSSTSPVTVNALGTYDSPVTQFGKYGTYFWVESYFSHDGQLIHRGECGAAEETTLVAPGVVITQAVVRATPGSEVHDTAFVSGLVPQGATLVFEAFAQPSTGDGPRCDASTRVFRSAPVAVTGVGRYESASTRITTPGTYHWVETMFDRNGQPLHVGRCGVASETTTVGTASLARTGAPIAPGVLAASSLLLLGMTVCGVAALGRRREYR